MEDLKLFLNIEDTSKHLCFTHAVQRAIKGEKIESCVDSSNAYSSSPISTLCIDCYAGVRNNSPKGSD